MWMGEVVWVDGSGCLSWGVGFMAVFGFRGEKIGC